MSENSVLIFKKKKEIEYILHELQSNILTMVNLVGRKSSNA